MVARIRLDRVAVRAELNRIAGRDVARVAREVETLAKLYAPVDTGRLRGSIQARPRVTFRGPTIRVEANVNYATFVENGTDPHVIRPKNKKVLKFRVGGRVVYAKIVHHPGTKAVHFMARAVRQAGIRNGYNVRTT